MDILGREPTPVQPGSELVPQSLRPLSGVGEVPWIRLHGVSVGSNEVVCKRLFARDIFGEMTVEVVDAIGWWIVSIVGLCWVCRWLYRNSDF